MESARNTNWKRYVLALLLFGVAFGYLEAAVVSYLRALHEPARQRFYPGRNPDDLFPLLTLDQARTAGQTRTLTIEIGREAATLIMLAAVALAVSNHVGPWVAAFAIAFGAWDLTFYVFLRILLGWPASPLTWDILFLLPVPWVGPVLAPSLVSVAMIVAGMWHLQREEKGRPVHIAPWHWMGMVLGAGVVIVSFTLDYRNILAGGMPRPFHWPLFALGMAAGMVSYLSAVRSSTAPERAQAVRA